MSSLLSTSLISWFHDWCLSSASWSFSFLNRIWYFLYSLKILMIVKFFKWSSFWISLLHNICASVTSLNSKKIEVVTSWSMSKMKIEIQFFLEFANFYRQFIKKYFRIISSLTNLTRKDISFVWTEKAEEVFKMLKKLFIFQSILIMFESEKSITLEMNMLNEVIKACINQSDDKRHLHFITFHSKKLTDAELNYKIHDKKLLIIVDSFK